MAKFEYRTYHFDEPNDGVTLEFLQEVAKAHNVPTGAFIDCDYGDWHFWWKEQLSPAEEQADRLRRLAEERKIELEEREDREAGF